MGGILRAIRTLLLGGLGVLIGAAIIVGALIFTGDPQACVDRVITPDGAASQQLRAQWRQFSAQAARAPATIQVTELQATSRGVDFISEEDVPVDDLQVYFCPGGYAEASGKIDVAGLKAKVVVRGTLDLSGETPRIQVDEVRAGNLPSAIARPAVDFIFDQGDVRTLDLKEKLRSIEYSDGRATVTGGP